MCGDLPDLVDLASEAARNGSYKGMLDCRKLSRLRDQLFDAQASQVSFDLSFYRDEEGRNVVAARLSGSLLLQCQRCLGPVELPLDSRIRLAVVSGIDEGNRLPEDYEPLWTEGRLVRPVDVLEDDLILSVPLVPLHGGEACETPQMKSSDVVHDRDRTEQPERHPFAALAGLRSRGERSEPT